MPRTAHFDCFSGIAGDMTVAALIDAGCPFELLEETLAKLNLPGVSISTEPIKRHGIAARRFIVEIGPDAPKRHRHLHHIEEIIAAAGLKPRVAEQAIEAFRRLAEAEAEVHQTTLKKVHFHEVGADDAIVDIVCACVALDALGIERVTASPVAPGNGTVTCEHGVMPVPAPATARLLQGVPLLATEEQAELTTPTGAALLTTWTQSFGATPSLQLEATGTGTGTREGKTRPNLLRVMIGSDGVEASAGAQDEVVVLETQVDDATGQTLGHTLTELLNHGALDAYIVPIIMKKGRPGQLLTVLVRSGDVPAIEERIFRETGTFGIRRSTAQRSILDRSFESVDTPWGTVRVKLGRRGETHLRAWPEYEDCAALARKAGVGLDRVQQAALQAWWQKHDDTGGQPG